MDETVDRATLAGEPEQQDEEHAVPIVVRHQQVRQRHSRRKPQRIQRPLGRGDVLLRQMIRTIAGAKTGQQRPCDVLVPDVEKCPAGHHVERNFRDHGQHKEAPGVAAQVMRVHIALHELKGKQGKAMRPT